MCVVLTERGFVRKFRDIFGKESLGMVVGDGVGDGKFDVEQGLGMGKAADPAKHPSHCQVCMSRCRFYRFVCVFGSFVEVSNKGLSVNNGTA